MNGVYLNSPAEIAATVAKRLRDRRLGENLSQEGLAVRSGVMLASLKRFERTGKISFESLIKLAFALDAIEEFELLFPTSNTNRSRTYSNGKKRDSVALDALERFIDRRDILENLIAKRAAFQPISGQSSPCRKLNADCRSPSFHRLH